MIFKKSDVGMYVSLSLIGAGLGVLTAVAGQYIHELVKERREVEEPDPEVYVERREDDWVELNHQERVERAAEVLLEEKKAPEEPFSYNALYKPNRDQKPDLDELVDDEDEQELDELISQIVVSFEDRDDYTLKFQYIPRYPDSQESDKLRYFSARGNEVVVQAHQVTRWIPKETWEQVRRLLNENDEAFVTVDAGDGQTFYRFSFLEDDEYFDVPD